MITDTEIRVKGMEILIEEMGMVEAERFISSFLREPFDYTIWQRTMLKDSSLEDISAMAMQHRQKTQN